MCDQMCGSLISFGNVYHIATNFVIFVMKEHAAKILIGEIFTCACAVYMHIIMAKCYHVNRRRQENDKNYETVVTRQ